MNSPSNAELRNVYHSKKLSSFLAVRGWPEALAKELAKLPGAMTRDLGYPEAEARRLITKYQITDGDGEALGVAPVGVAAMIDTTVTQYLQEHEQQVEKQAVALKSTFDLPGSEGKMSTMCSLPCKESFQWGWPCDVCWSSEDACPPWLLCLRRGAWRFGVTSLPFSGLPQYVYLPSGSCTLFVVHTKWLVINKVGNADADLTHFLQDAANAHKFLSECDIIHLETGWCAYLPQCCVALPLATMTDPEVLCLMIFPMLSKRLAMRDQGWKCVQQPLQSFWTSKKDFPPYNTVAEKVISFLEAED